LVGASHLKTDLRLPEASSALDIESTWYRGHFEADAIMGSGHVPADAPQSLLSLLGEYAKVVPDVVFQRLRLMGTPEIDSLCESMVGKNCIVTGE